MKTKAFINWGLLFPTILLSILGLSILQSIAPDQVLGQATILVIGLATFLLISRLDYHWFASFYWGFYGLSLILLVLTLVFGQTAKGAARWFSIGSFKLQTSEFIKPMLIIFFSQLANKMGSNSLKKVFTSLILFLIPTFLVFRQPDLGSTLVLLSLWFSIMFISGISWKLVISGLLTVFLLFPLSWNLLQDYQKARLTTFINPLSDPLLSGYNLLQSIIAVGSGQVWGRGLGQGTQSQLNFLPERHTDFIFASLSEELGLIGAVVLITLFSSLFYKILQISQQSKENFASFLSFGVFAQLSFQTFINIGMNIGLVPITGLTLPLVSSGGSSLLSTFISLGLVASVAKAKKHLHMFEIN